VNYELRTAPKEPCSSSYSQRKNRQPRREVARQRGHGVRPSTSTRTSMPRRSPLQSRRVDVVVDFTAPKPLSKYPRRPRSRRRIVVGTPAVQTTRRAEGLAHRRAAHSSTEPTSPLAYRSSSASPRTRPARRLQLLHRRNHTLQARRPPAPPHLKEIILSVRPGIEIP